MNCKNKLWIIAVIALTGIVATTCDNGTTDSDRPAVTGYAAGRYIESGSRKACYWTITETGMVRTNLLIPAGADYSSARAITVADGMVCTAGYYNYYDEFKGYWVTRACYWKETTHSNLPVPAGVDYSRAEAITMVSGTVYTAGYYEESGKRKACYWTKGLCIDLPVPAGVNYSSADAITVVNGTVYTAGGYIESGIEKACYWMINETDMVRTDLPAPGGADGSWVEAITVVNGTVYTVGGYYDEESDVESACYWIEKERTDLSVPVGTAESYAGAITVVNGAVYTAGYYGYDIEKACYWKGAVRTDLPVPAGTSDSYAGAITVVNGTVYTAGSYYGSGISKICYWTGTVRTDLFVVQNDDEMISTFVVVK